MDFIVVLSTGQAEAEATGCCYDFCSLCKASQFGWTPMFSLYFRPYAVFLGDQYLFVH